jgi:hypothetical protein
MHPDGVQAGIADHELAAGSRSRMERMSSRMVENMKTGYRSL